MWVSLFVELCVSTSGREYSGDQGSNFPRTVATCTPQGHIPQDRCEGLRIF